MGFTRIQTPDRNLQLIQDNISNAVNPLQSIPMVGGNMLTNVSLISGQDNLVPHKLNHTPQFFIVSQLNVNSTLWSPDSSQLNGASANGSYINLQCSTSCVVSVWVN